MPHVIVCRWIHAGRRAQLGNKLLSGQSTFSCHSYRVPSASSYYVSVPDWIRPWSMLCTYPEYVIARVLCAL